jgi:GTP-binding protein Era
MEVSVREIDIDDLGSGESAPEPYKCGLVAMVGLPNAGKSTLVNALVGEKVSAISPIPQTTRTLIRGILTEPRGQIVFLDTPGIHRLSHAFNHLMVDMSREALLGAHVIVWVISLDPMPSRDDVDRMRNLLLPILDGRPLLIAATKMDKTGGQGMIPRLLEIESWGLPGEIIPVSGAKNKNLDRFLDVVFRHLPEGENLFDPELYTNQTVRQLVRELIQEKIFWSLREEVPHQSAVMIEEYLEPEGPKGITTIRGVIIVERDSQKAIMIGSGGERIRDVSEKARLEIERLVGGKVFLRMLVKVEPAWRDNPRILRELGYIGE